MLLNSHTYFSFHYGVLSVEDLLAEVKTKGYKGFVLSDINNTSGILDAIRLAPEKDMKVIPGIDFRNDFTQQYVGIAKNNAGYRELNEHLSIHLHNDKPFESEAPQFADAYLVYPFASYSNQVLREDCYIGISARQLMQLPFSSFRHLIPRMVILQPLTFAGKKHHNAHRLLQAIGKNTLLSRLPPSEQTVGGIVPAKNELLKLFAGYTQIINNTQSILETCCVQLE